MIEFIEKTMIPSIYEILSLFAKLLNPNITKKTIIKLPIQEIPLKLP